MTRSLTAVYQWTVDSTGRHSRVPICIRIEPACLIGSNNGVSSQKVLFEVHVEELDEWLRVNALAAVEIDWTVEWCQ